MDKVLPLISYTCLFQVTRVWHNTAQNQKQMKPPLPKSTEASFKLRNRDTDLQSSFFSPYWNATGRRLEMLLCK